MDARDYQRRGAQMQNLGKRIGLAILSIGLALIVLCIIAGLFYTAVTS